MTCSVPPLAGDVGAESHDLLSKSQQGGWFTQQNAAARVSSVRRYFHILRGQFLNPMDPAQVGILERIEQALVGGPEIALQNLGQHKVITVIS